MKRLIKELAALRVKDEENKTRKELFDLDNRLDIKQKLKRIRACDHTYPDELDEFEKQLDRNGVKGWKLWYHYFEQALDEPARKWVTYSQTVEPGKGALLTALDPRSSDVCWKEVYRLARAELARKLGLNFESPQEMAQAAWDRIHFGKDDDWTDIDNTLTWLMLVFECRRRVG